jgi:Cd2+/Zn2+-exporting ATPase
MMAHPNADQDLDACEPNNAQTCGCGCGSPRSDRPNPSPKTGDTRSINFSGFFRDFWKTPDLLTVCIGLALLVLTLFAERWGLREPWIRLIQLLLLPVAGWPVFRDGTVTLFRRGSLNMNVLMAAAAIGTVILGETHEAIFMLILFTISESLESYINGNARAILMEFADLAPNTAIRVGETGEEEVAVESLNPGDVVIVRPGDRIPMDGRVTHGSSMVNQAPITGESKLIEKTVGDEVLSGSINGQGALRLKVTRFAQDNTIQRIIRLVTEAQENKAEQVKFIDRFAAVYTPIVFIVAILFATVPVLFFGQPRWNQPGSYGWLHRSLSLLMVGCPCALVISTPITMISGLTRGAKAGVVFKGGVFLEALSKTGVIAFDKTGTLTKGEPVVSRVKAVDCLGTQDCERCDDLVAYTHALEAHSSHPLSAAVIQEACRRGVAELYPPAEDLVVLEGRGQAGVINGKTGTVGNLALFLDEHDTPETLVSEVRDAENQGETTMLVCDGERVRGFLSVEDATRENVRSVVDEIKAEGIHPVMLTGDNRQVAQKVAAQVGIDEVHAALLPEDKLRWLETLKAEYGTVIMAGDGINDSPALARADVGIGMGGAGNAQVLETADVVLLDDDLEKLPFAIRLSKFVNKLIRQNVFISLGVKFLAALIALLGLTPLWVAVMADIGISLLVTLNGTRGLRFEV